MILITHSWINLLKNYFKKIWTLTINLFGINLFYIWIEISLFQRKSLRIFYKVKYQRLINLDCFLIMLRNLLKKSYKKNLKIFRIIKLITLMKPLLIKNLCTTFLISKAIWVILTIRKYLINKNLELWSRGIWPKQMKKIWLNWKSCLLIMVTQRQ